MRTIILSPSAAKDIDGLPRDAREMVEQGLVDYSLAGAGSIVKLSGRDGYRLRVGRYRVIFDQDEITILAIYIGKRETVTYRRH